jgi:hypothetical protein
MYETWYNSHSSTYFHARFTTSSVLYYTLPLLWFFYCSSVPIVISIPTYALELGGVAALFFTLLSYISFRENRHCLSLLSFVIWNPPKSLWRFPPCTFFSTVSLPTTSCCTQKKKLPRDVSPPSHSLDRLCAAHLSFSVSFFSLICLLALSAYVTFRSNACAFHLFEPKRAPEIDIPIHYLS